MAIRAVVFDIGGVLEITQDLSPTRSQDSITRSWETRLGWPAGEIDVRMRDAWIGGGVGTVTLDEVHQALRDRVGLDDEQVAAFMADLWREYLGTANTELIEYARGLRPRYRTGILSNSFVGAREQEQAAYGFEDLVDDIVYSHECGMAKPDPRIFALTCERLGVRPEETIFVDDYAPNVEAARAAGLHALLYTDHATVIGQIERLLAEET
jgi:epoxide hydrolase-like predicted phosphatase